MLRSLHLTVCAVVMFQTASTNVDCDSDTQITLSVIGNICPYKPVTLRCVAKKNYDFLSWKCSGAEKAQDFINCSDIFDFSCEFGEVVNVTGSCECDNSVIVSEATFVPKSDGPDTGSLTCSNGGEEETVSVTAMKALQTPVLNYTVLSSDGDIHTLTVNWTTPDSSMTGIEYVLTLYNASTNPTEYTTKHLNHNLSLHTGIQYELTIFSQRCNGSVKSNSSKSLKILFPVMEFPGGSERRDTIIIGVVLGVFSVIGLSFLSLLGIIALALCYKKIQTVQTMGKLRCEWISYGNKTYGKSSIINDITGVGAICVDDDYIYYSTYETCENGSFMYPLRKYDQKEKEKMPTCVVGFDRIRGIAKDNKNNIYVVDSCKGQAVKFDCNLNPGSVFQTFLPLNYGILVTDKYIFICARTGNRICIFNPNNNIWWKIKHNIMLPNQTDITMLNGTYFVTTDSAIVVITINFDNGTYIAHKIKGMYYNSNNFEHFNQDKQLRGICSDDKYLYVAEKNGRLLILKYDEVKKQLHCIDSIMCSPIVVAHHNGTIYFSRKGNNEKFFIAKVIANNGTDYKDIFQV